MEPGLGWVDGPQGRPRLHANAPPPRHPRNQVPGVPLSRLSRATAGAGHHPHFEGVAGAAGVVDAGLAVESDDGAGLDSFSEEPESPFGLPLPLPPLLLLA
jgi:hypothetical protein